MRRYRVAVDIGGTFVDAIQFDRETGSIKLAKASTTPRHPVDGVIQALEKLSANLNEAEIFVHGTTLGLNAILERKGAITGIITNQNFRDIFEIGRADVPPDHMYDFMYERAPALVKRRCRLGVPARVNAKGEVITPLDETALEAAANKLIESGAQSIAVSFLHSYKNPEHERRAADLLRAKFPNIAVSISSEITREYREYERTATVVLDAYIRPIFESYIAELETAIENKGFVGLFLVMRSSGGAMTSRAAKVTPIFTVMSGPAGGIIGAAYIAQTLNKTRLLSLDYGGTSLDASVIEDGYPLVMHRATLEHFPVLIPIFDIRCIGAGGGSIAWVQEGLLQVGPQSAGAVPGPIAYGKGGVEPTTTDAALVLGYLDPDNFLGGAITLNARASLTGVESRIAKVLGTDAVAAAAGVFDVLIARTVGAIREITVERGKDPKDFSLLVFGGAGPMIAPLLAREMAIPEMIVPNVPAAFSAWGMLMSDLASDASQTNIQPLLEDYMGTVTAGFRDLEEKAKTALRQQGIEDHRQTLHRTLECRYVGQEHTLEVPVNGMHSAEELRKSFDSLHEARYGHATPDVVQVVTLRVRAGSRLEKPSLSKLPKASSTTAAAFRGRRPAYCFARREISEFEVYGRSLLAPGHTILGPAIIDEDTSTTVIHSDQQLVVDDYGQLIIKEKGK